MVRGWPSGRWNVHVSKNKWSDRGAACPTSCSCSDYLGATTCSSKQGSHVPAFLSSDDNSFGASTERWIDFIYKKKISWEELEESRVGRLFFLFFRSINSWLHCTGSMQSIRIPDQNNGLEGALSFFSSFNPFLNPLVTVRGVQKSTAKWSNLSLQRCCLQLILQVYKEENMTVERDPV